MGTLARLAPALLPLLALACGDSGEEASVPARAENAPRVAVETTDPAASPTTDVPLDPEFLDPGFLDPGFLGPGFEGLQSDGSGALAQGGPEMPPEFDLQALLRAAERPDEQEISGPQPPALPLDPSAYLVGVIRMRGKTAFLKLEGTASQLATSALPLRRACQSFEMVEGELRWTVPKSIQATFGVQGSMVPADLTLTFDATVQGSLTLLGGDGGGLDGNVLRWLRQLNRPRPTDDALRAFLRRQERFLSAGGLDVVIVDLSGAIE